MADLIIPNQLAQPKETAHLHVSLFSNNSVGVNYPKDFTLAFNLVGEAVKLLANQAKFPAVTMTILDMCGQIIQLLSMQLKGTPESKIVIPTIIPPKDLLVK